jgi:hypothetical protein
MAIGGVSAVEDSGNIKIGIMSATYVSQRSCPPSCIWLKPVLVVKKRTQKFTHIAWVKPCYALHGQTLWSTNRVNRQADALDLDSIQLAINEANAIDGLTGKNWLRLHVVGDCRSDESARIVSDAVKVYKLKHGQGAHTYTHAWKDVARDSWQDVSVLASVETLQDARNALKRGYAPSMVISDKHQSKMAYKQDELTMVPCPQQTGASKNCLTCRLCFKDKLLLARKMVIVFQPDTNTDKSVQQALIQIGGNQ